VGGLLDVVRSPAYATGVGLVKYGAAKLRAMPQMAPLQVEQSQVVATAAGANWGARIGAWFKEVF
jgi:cell division ATPase FtsA